MVRRRGGPSVRINQLRAPREADARDRSEAGYAAVDALTPDALDVVPIHVIDRVDRDRRIEALEAVAERAGRRELLDTARDRLQQAVLERFASRIASPYGMQIVGSARVEDRSAVIRALRDLVAVSVL